MSQPKPWPETNERIDLLGHNGNDGLHYEAPAMNDTTVKQMVDATSKSETSRQLGVHWKTVAKCYQDTDGNKHIVRYNHGIPSLFTRRGDC